MLLFLHWFNVEKIRLLRSWTQISCLLRYQILQVVRIMFSSVSSIIREKLSCINVSLLKIFIAHSFGEFSFNCMVQIGLFKTWVESLCIVVYKLTAKVGFPVCLVARFFAFSRNSVSFKIYIVLLLRSYIHVL